ncbi:MAG: glucose-1-phosphate cytidylyltransferase [Planctomycetota bacterium]
MKVVLFCGGLGLRLRNQNGIPKPMVEIGYRPILWHMMKYYAHFGHKEFILCLGYRADTIKNYFLSYNECLSNDFVLSDGGRSVELLGSDIDDWSITFVDTGYSSTIGGRLKAVEEHLAGEEVFLANYSDNLTDFHLPLLIDEFLSSDRVCSFLCVKPTQSFHVVHPGEDGEVREIKEIARSGLWINGGYFVLRRQIFDYMRDGEELVHEPFQRLINEGKLASHLYEGFWACMDTFKDKQNLDRMYSTGEAPWEVWKSSAAGTGDRTPAAVPGSP